MYNLPRFSKHMQAHSPGHSDFWPHLITLQPLEASSDCSVTVLSVADRAKALLEDPVYTAGYSNQTQTHACLPLHSLTSSERLSVAPWPSGRGCTPAPSDSRAASTCTAVSAGSDMAACFSSLMEGHRESRRLQTASTNDYSLSKQRTNAQEEEAWAGRKSHPSICPSVNCLSCTGSRESHKTVTGRA